MSKFLLSHLSDPVLSRDLAAGVAGDCVSTALRLAQIAEFDARRLYVQAAHPSMFSYCVHALDMSDDSALKRIRAARTARKLPVVFDAVAEGRVHLTGVVLLTPYLTTGNADDLLAAAAHKTVWEIKRLLAERFPQPDLPTRIEVIPPTTSPLPIERLVSRPVEAQDGPGGDQLVSKPVAVAPIEAQLVSKPPLSTPPRPKLTPLAPERVALQVTLAQSTHDKMRYAQSLLGHAMPSGDIAQLIDRAFDALICLLEKRKFAATDRPQSARRRGPSRNERHVPSQVKRAVWLRDGGRCTFVSDTGTRCPERSALEYDHIDPVARGGKATVARMRLRCRAHNQYEAERMFGTEFMANKRQEARGRRMNEASRSTSHARLRATLASG